MVIFLVRLTKANSYSKVSCFSLPIIVTTISVQCVACPPHNTDLVWAKLLYLLVSQVKRDD